MGLHISLNWQNLCINYIMVRCPKSFDNFFKNIYNIHSYKTSCADNQNYFMQSLYKFWKKVFLREGLRSGKKSNRVLKSCPMSLSANIRIVFRLVIYE